MRENLFQQWIWFEKFSIFYVCDFKVNAADMYTYKHMILLAAQSHLYKLWTITVMQLACKLLQGPMSSLIVSAPKGALAGQ